jgi:outer membrane lipoprotein-sorting protein
MGFRSRLIKTVSTRCAAAVGGSAAILCISAPALAAPSASDILAQASQAYDALPNYQCHVDCQATSASGAFYHTTADIAFLRPGMIRAQGVDMFGHPYAYVSDGTNTWQYQAGAWTLAKSAELAVATVTGTTENAATTIPAALLHLDWGYPFSPELQVKPTVTSENVHGHACYRVIITAPFKEAYWIDKKTYLLDQLATNITFGAYHLKTLQVISKAGQSPDLTASAFAQPTGAPAPDSAAPPANATSP